ncbi:hypothetical protein MUK42_35802 [Musa troglodytarum]|uniref:Uncharacterized protein n=1 Tax=Musa troglodytarum TaxID=320322 RepID=A0A9E7HIA0_9LILI|nr:hypothetical protein MUK42_35802 [Musa troglodytarum]
MFQMVVVLKKITIVTMHSEASEEFHVGIIRCLRVLNLLPCSLSSCSFKQMVIMPTSKSIDGAFVHHNTLLRNHLSEYGKLFLASQEGYQPQLVNECDIYSEYHIPDQNPSEINLQKYKRNTKKRNHTNKEERNTEKSRRRGYADPRTSPKFLNTTRSNKTRGSYLNITPVNGIDACQSLTGELVVAQPCELVLCRMRAGERAEGQKASMLPVERGYEGLVLACDDVGVS